MRNLNDLNKWRRTDAEVWRFFGGIGDETCGMFVIPSMQRRGKTLLCIASTAADWDHVSVSMKRHTPSWGEMEQIKRMFFTDDEVAMQLHVAPVDHISVHDHCLHLWRPQRVGIPLPPKIMVG